MSKQVELKVLEAYTRDVGRGCIRIDYDTMDKLDLSTGNIIKIIGTKESVGKVVPLYPSDEGKEILRTDKLTRDNSGSSIGMTVKIEKIDCHNCEYLEVRGLEEIPNFDDRYVTDALEGLPIMINQQVLIPYFGTRLNLIISKTIPEGVTLITTKTKSKIIDRHEEERLEIEEPFENYRSGLISDMRKAIKEKDVTQIDTIIKKIQQVDFLKGSIKNILNDKSNTITMSYDESLIPVLQEVFKKEEPKHDS